MDSLLWINVGLGALGLLATLAAFGGDTWRTGPEALVTRVTPRGWISLACLSLAFVLGLTKERLEHRSREDLAAESEKLRNDNQAQRRKIEAQLAQITSMQSELDSAARSVGRSAESLDKTTDTIASQQLASIEAAFAIAGATPRETDDAVVHLRGQPAVPIPSRHSERMLLYWGDQFQFTLMWEGDDIAPAMLASLKLDVGDREYPLHDGESGGFFESTIRIYGNSPEAMPVHIINPQRLAGVVVKVFVRTTDSSQGQSEFRRLVLDSPFASLAKRIYKVTSADILNVRTNPRLESQVRLRLARGSFVRVLQTSGNWLEIVTPRRRQGWVARQFIEDIE